MKITPATQLARGSRAMSLRTRYQTRFACAVAFSVFVHILILALRFGAPGAGLPGLDLPWAERRVQASGLTVRLLELPPSTAPASEALPSASDGGIRLKLATELSNVPRPIVAHRAFEGAIVKAPPPSASPPPAARRNPRQTATSTSERQAVASAQTASAPDRNMPPRRLPPILVQQPPREDTFNVPPPRETMADALRAPESTARTQTEEPPSPVHTVEDALRKQAEEGLRRQADESLRRHAEETARLQAEQAAREREEEARRLAVALEKEREVRKLAEEKARREAEDLARQRALALQKAQEEAKRLALEAEARKHAEDELARQQAIAREKEIAERERAEREAAARRERERLAMERPPGAPQPRALSGTELAAKALEQFRRPTPPHVEPPRPQPSTAAPDTRRRSIFGVEREVSLRMYVDSWRWKIERSGTYNYRPAAAFNARENPIVTVSIRSDGSLEDVLIHRSSGVREIDDAVVRIAQLHAPYSKFPPDLARQYDVIEIRRVWLFHTTLRIVDGL